MTSTLIFRRSNGSKTDAYRRADQFGSINGQTSIYMIVDDSRLLLDCLKLTAEAFLNCEVAGFTSPKEAWQAFRRNPKSYRGIVTDFHMPQMTGWNLIQRFRPAFPELPVILMSGEMRLAEVPVEYNPFTRYVRKPFEWQDVISQLDELESQRRD